MNIICIPFFHPVHEPFSAYMTLMDRTEEEKQLVYRIARQDRDAFQLLYDMTYGRVARYVMKFVNNETLAEDVLMQTYTIVWQRASGFRGQGRVTTWIIGIARNVACKEFRKLPAQTLFDESHVGADCESCRSYERSDTHARTKKALLALSRKHQEILELVFFQGFNYEEISGMIDIPVNTVKTRVFHAKKSLKEELRKRNINAHDI